MPLSRAIFCLLVVALSFTPDLARAACGDGILDSGEECDDFNTADGDGCDASCTVEEGWECVDAGFALDFDETLYDVSSDSTPSWSLSSDELTVTQSRNADPAVYMSTLPAVGVSMSFDLTVNTSSDDDFIGWVIGYESGENTASNPDYLLFDWKQSDQTYSGYYAADGLCMNRIQGPIVDWYDLWSHDNYVVEVARAINLGSTGWNDNQTYEIQVDYSTTQVDVYVDGSLEFSESGSFPTGYFGFYNYSQEDIEYTLVSPTDRSVCGYADTDGDGLTDLVELELGTDETQVDSDGDGIDDLSEVGDVDDPTDSDGDGDIDAVDADDDGDGIDTIDEDPDGDGDPTDDDSDGDGTPDYLDPDDDDDGVDTIDEDYDGDGDPQNGDADGDGTPDYLQPDADSDGYGDASDCQPADASVNPAAVELCDGIDNDCDGATDEDDAADAATWYADADGDGYGDAGSSATACSQPSGYVADASDCDDGEVLANPGLAETCDGIDNDCDGVTDEDDASDAGTWYADVDGDGYGDAGSGATACSQPSGYVADATDCDDGESLANPGAAELCDGLDNDCDGVTDEDDAIDAGTWYADADGDGYGDAGSAVMACSQPSGYVADASDCDDGDGLVNPAAVELCDGADNDCDGSTDEDDAADAGTWYADTDSDGYGDAGSSATACSQPSGYVADATDCDDGDGTIHPGAKETWYDGTDQDCDGWSDYDMDGDGFDSESYGGDDCDDADESVYPGAPDEPYDGVISDCDNVDDYDADQDGYASSEYGGEDCDDANSEIHPEAEETWYDGVDQDCDENDADQDEDGWLVDEDCDDTDPEVYPGAEGWTEDCLPVTGDSGLAGDTALPGDSASSGKADCGCASGRAAPSVLLLGLLGLVSVGRRRKGGS